MDRKYHQLAVVLALVLRSGVVPISILPHTVPTFRSTTTSVDNPSPPGSPVRLVFVHHSVGDDWLNAGIGDLGDLLGANNYYVSDTYYEWGPDEIGSHTDIGNWWDWFRGPRSDVYTQAVYDTTNQHADYHRPMADPGDENEIIVLKSCYPNSHLGGSPDDPPPAGPNPLRGEGSSSEHYTVSNAKGIYNDILKYFASQQDKLFVVITAPPLWGSETDPAHAANARDFNTWLVQDWLDGYPHNNVAVFDLYNVLTSNGGDWHTNDLGWEAGNHHRYRNGSIQYITNQGGNTAAYPDGGNDSHPSPAGHQKSGGEFVPMLNIYYHRWADGFGAPTPTATGALYTATPTATMTSATLGTTTPTRRAMVHLPLILKGVARTIWPLPTSTASRTATGIQSPTASPTRAATHTPLCASAQPTFVTDFQVRQAPSLPEPAPRAPFRDPVFGACVVRVTDRANDLSPGDDSTGLVNEYSRVQSFNADGSRLLAHGTEGTWYLYDAQTLLPLGELPLGVEPRWDPVDPHVLYYSEETRLMSYNVQTAAQTLIREFANDFPGQDLASVWMCHEGSPSRDRRYWSLIAEDQDWIPVAFLVYDRQTDQVTIRDMRGVPGIQEDVDHVTMSPLGTYFLASFDRYCGPGRLGDDAHPCGLMVYDRDLTNGRGLLRIIGHYDPALDAQGREVIIYQDIDTDNISVLDLATGAVTPLWPIDFGHTGIGPHFSGQAFNLPGWAVVSTHDDDAATHTWMDDQVFVVELEPGGRVVRLAHTHSLVDESQPIAHFYWAEPHASTNLDLTRILFTTNWGRFDTGEVEMFMIALPSDWPTQLSP